MPIFFNIAVQIIIIIIDKVFCVSFGFDDLRAEPSIL